MMKLALFAATVGTALALYSASDATIELTDATFDKRGEDRRAVAGRVEVGARACVPLTCVRVVTSSSPTHHGRRPRVKPTVGRVRDVTGITQLSARAAPPAPPLPTPPQS